ncbi:MAG: DUF167 domain-containing protein [Desulfuromonadales bacterium]
MTLPCLRQTVAGVEIYLYLQPRASRNQVVGLQGQELKIALTAPPVEGAANKACCLFLAKLCSLPRSCVKLVSGDRSRHKRVLLEGADLEKVMCLLDDLLRG